MASSTLVSDTTSELIAEPMAPPRRRFRLLRQPQIAIGTVILAVMLFMAVFARQISPHDPYRQNLPQQLAPPSLEHPLGTDRLGRDIFVRLLVGARVSLLFAGASVAIGGTAGTLLGLFSGYWGGLVDVVIMRMVDAFLAFPTTLLALVIVATLGTEVQYVIMAIAISVTPRFARIVRGSVLTEKFKDYIMAVRALGAGNGRIIFVHILPNVLSPVLVTATFLVATAILTEAFLGFLGLGIQAPVPTWGNSINEGLRQIRTHPGLSIYPGIAITLAVLAFNLLGDGLRDALDPTLRNRG
jgi:peptide/nickel transport system permease protein